MIRQVWTFFAFLAMLHSLVFAQGGGAVTGIITDPSGAALAGAQVRLTRTATGTISTTIATQAGVYNFPGVPIGTYQLEVEAASFKTFMHTSIVVETGQTLRIDAQLEIGQTTESIVVTSEVPLLSQETSSIGTQVSQTMLNQLPFQISGAMRNPFAFLRLTPGAWGNSGASGDTNIAGGRAWGAEFFVDGSQLTYNATQSVADVANPAYDIVAEFRVESVIPPAEHGRTSGGVVMMNTRSGTNEFHGNVLGLFRNHIFDARRYNANKPDLARQGEFAGSLGGPVWIPKLYDGRNRTFFFGNYTGFRRLHFAGGQTVTLATMAMRGGNFSEQPQRVFDPLTADLSGLRQQFPNNTIPVARFSDYGKAINAATPVPTNGNLAANYMGDRVTGEDSDAGFIRLDHQFSEPLRVTGSYRHQNRKRMDSTGPLPVLDLIVDGPDTRNFTVSSDWIARPNIVNRVQFGLTHFDNNRQETVGNLNIKIPGAFAAGTAAAVFSSQGLKQIGIDNSRNPTNYNWSLTDAVSWTHGNHNSKFGIRFDRYDNNFRPYGNNAGTYSFSQFGTSQPNVAGTGHSYASMLLGLVNSASLSKALTQLTRSRYFAVYAQDDWKVARRFTLNYGLRWEVQEPWIEPEGNASIMDPTTPNPGAAGALGAMVFAGEGAGRIGGKRFMLADLNNVSPRLGFAWQMTPSTVVRGGYGVMYAPLLGDDMLRQGFNANISISSVDGGITPAFHIDSGWPAGVVKAPPFINPTVANGQSTAMIEQRRGGSGSMPMTQQWQLGVQHTLRGVLIETSYVATVGHGITNSSLVVPNQISPDYLRLGSLLNMNINNPLVQAQGFRAPYDGFQGTLAQSLRQFPQYQGVTVMDTPTGNSTYHALFVKSEKRFSNGLQFLLSYAFSKTISDVNFNASERSSPQDQFNRRAEKSITETHKPHRFVLSYSYEFPFGRDKRWLNRGLVTHLVGGWSISGIQTYESGPPLRITTPNNLPIFNGHLRPNRVNDQPIRIGPGRDKFQPYNALTGQAGDLMLNRNAFAVPQPFTFGTLGVFLPNVRGMDIRNEDLSLRKLIRVSERISTEFSVHLFNAFNRRNLGLPITDLTHPNFGRVTSQWGARVLQLGWRMDF